MELKTISQVSGHFGVSTRTLRYYEQIGLITPSKKDDFAYRVYDEHSLSRLRQIIILRKLRIPLKKIAEILQSGDAAVAIEAFEQNLAEINSEIAALSTIRTIINVFIKRLNLGGAAFALPDDESLLEVVDALTVSKINFKEDKPAENFSMDALNAAMDVLNKPRDVRIVHLPPMTVASVFCTGENPEEQAWQILCDFLRESNLPQIKPDLRCFMLDHSNAIGKNFGREIFVSIPDDLTLPAPFVKKIFHGGLYAAQFLGKDVPEPFLGMQDWINESDKYQFDWNFARFTPPIKDITDTFGGIQPVLEEVLNIYNFQNPQYERQVDALYPIKDYVPIEEPAPQEIPGSKEKCGFKASITQRNKFKILGFTKIMSGNATVEQFIQEITADGRLALLNSFRKPGTPLLSYGSHDADSAMRGGWRMTFCLMEANITDVQAFMKHNSYTETIDATKWLVFEHTRKDDFDDHSTCMKLGYIWNGIISGSFSAYPDGKIDKPVSEPEKNSPVYCWYPVK